MAGGSTGNGSGATGTPATEEGLLRAEFLAEDELIEINPSVRTSLITLVRGTYGPFEPSMSTIVPLWLALALKKVQRCKLLPPLWFTAKAVEEVVASERREESNLQPLNFYFWEISSLLLAHASDDLDSPGDLRRGVEDLSNIRSSKLRRWMQASVRDRVNAIKLNNLCMHEIELHRPVLTRVLDDLYRIHIPGQEGTLSSSMTGTTSSQSPLTPNTVNTTPATPATPSATAGTTASIDTPPAPQRRTLRRVIRRT